jgi:hypothetical protein
MGADAGAETTTGQSIGVQAAILGHVCEGPVGSTLKFTIIASGSIPANSTWTVSASRVDWADFKATPDSALIQTTRISKSSVLLTALTALPSGTVVKVTPANWYVVSGGSTTLTISGYGGSHQVVDSMTSHPC